ncbi:hypothetical protein O6H91_11G053900 [Diphasiastrum complanatum]|uniref:Uncharacterized protein n=1 Tax=Diphasiastrum complanatum TaxID=34168 RepID=A0ACC2C971_DIPCM|nr:hypothetical protein O6H91_11G053900 [Diphasiastrum complanatum]
MAVLGSTLLFLALLGFVLATCAEARQALVICPSIVRAVEGLLNNVSIHGSALSFDGAMAIKRGGSAVRRGNYSACDGQSGHFWFKGGDLPSDDWPPLVFNARTMVAMVLAAIGASLSSAGGVGGGGLFVPIFNLLLQFDAKTSAALCNFMIFGGMFANISLNSLQHHPSHSERSMIDLDAALLIQPNMLLGICLGVFCNVMFPGWLIILLLTIILIVVTSRSCGYGVRLWKKESCIAFHERTMLARVTGCMAHEEGNKCGTNHDMIAESVCGTETLPISLENGDIAAVVRSNESNVTAKEAETQSKLPQNSLQEPLLPLGSPEGSNYSYMKLLMLVIVWFAFFALQILRGGKTSESMLHLEPCGIGYWLLTGLQVPLSVAITAWTASHLQGKNKGSFSRLPQEGDLLPAAYTMLPVMALLAGILGGMLGIGGGMIINPILLEIGMLPQVTAATSALLVFFSSSLSVVQFWLMGRIPIEHAIIFAILCFVFSGLGLLTLQRVITRYGRASLIVFCLSFVMGLSAILMGFFGSLDVWGQYSRGEYMGFHTPC